MVAARKADTNNEGCKTNCNGHVQCYHQVSLIIFAVLSHYLNSIICIHNAENLVFTYYELNIFNLILSIIVVKYLFVYFLLYSFSQIYHITSTCKMFLIKDHMSSLIWTAKN